MFWIYFLIAWFSCAFITFCFMFYEIKHAVVINPMEPAYNDEYEFKYETLNNKN